MRFGPILPNAVDDDVNLCVRQHAARLLRKRLHGGSGPSHLDDTPHRSNIGDREARRVAYADFQSSLRFYAMATRTVLTIKPAEIGDLAGANDARDRHVSSRCSAGYKPQDGCEN